MARREAQALRKKRLLSAIAEVFVREAVPFEQPNGLSDSFGLEGMSYSSFRPASLSSWI
jgi:hypothetical protein